MYIFINIFDIDRNSLLFAVKCQRLDSCHFCKLKKTCSFSPSLFPLKVLLKIFDLGDNLYKLTQLFKLRLSFS